MASCLRGAQRNELLAGAAIRVCEASEYMLAKLTLKCRNLPLKASGRAQERCLRANS